MKRSNLYAMILIAVLLVGLAAVVFQRGGSIIDILYADSAYIEGKTLEPTFSLSEISYEYTNLENAVISNFGTVNDTKSVDGKGLGMIVEWDDITYSYVWFAICFNVLSEYTEKMFDLNPRLVVHVNHSDYYNYTLSACVSQLRFTSGPIIWDFERFGSGNGSLILDLNTSVVSSTWYNATTEDGIFRPMISFCLLVRPSYRTYISVDYLGVSVVENP